MNLFSDVKSFFRFDAESKRDIRDKLNPLGAAEAHILWKTRLGHHVQGNIREPVEAVLVGQSGPCQLGMWINSAEFELLKGMPAFDQLHEAHREFHQSGALILEKLQVGHRNEATLIFKNEYNRALHRIIQALTNINKHLQED